MNRVSLQDCAGEDGTGCIKTVTGRSPVHKSELIVRFRSSKAPQSTDIWLQYPNNPGYCVKMLETGFGLNTFLLAGTQN